MWHQNNLFFSKSDIVCTVNGLCSAKSPGATIQHLSEKGFSLKSCPESMPTACPCNLMNIMGLTLSVDLLGSFSLGILQQNRSPFSCWWLHNQASILSLEDSLYCLTFHLFSPSSIHFRIYSLKQEFQRAILSHQTVAWVLCCGDRNTNGEFYTGGCEGKSVNTNINQIYL